MAEVDFAEVGEEQLADQEAAESVADSPEGFLDRIARSLFEPPQRPFTEARNASLEELWSPETGGVNRLLYVAEELAGGGAMPLIGHIPIGLAEIAVESGMIEQEQSGDGAEQNGAGETVEWQTPKEEWG